MLLFSGCGSSKSSQPRSTESPVSKQKYTTKKLPKFYRNPPKSRDYYYGVGMAKKLNPQMAEDVARGRATDAVAAEVEVKISSILRDFMEESGIDGNSRALEFNDVVRQKVVDEVKEKCKIKESSPKTVSRIFGRLLSTEKIYKSQIACVMLCVV